MNKKEINFFSDLMLEIIVEAGKIALENQKEISNDKKSIQKLAGDNEYVNQRRSAKTVIDEKIQEFLLEEIIKNFDPKEIFLDAEEQTLSTKFFSKNLTETILVIDPVDGTLEYVLGSNFYSVNIGLIISGKLVFAGVYFPAKKELYFLKENKVYLKKGEKIEILVAPFKKESEKVFVNNRIEKKYIDSLRQNNFEVFIDSRENGLIWPEALIKCLNGKIGACIFHTPQIRDVLLGFIITDITSGYALDFKGKEINSFSAGRISGVIFGFKPISEKVLDVFKNS